MTTTTRMTFDEYMATAEKLDVLISNALDRCTDPNVRQVLEAKEQVLEENEESVFAIVAELD